VKNVPEAIDAPGRTVIIVNGAQQTAQFSELRALKRYVFAGFSIAAIVLVLIAVFSFANLLRFRTDAKAVAHTHQVLNSLSHLSSDLTAAESSQRGYLITGNDEYQHSFDDDATKIQRQLADLQQMTRDNPVQQMNLKALAPLLTESLTLMRTRLDLVHKQGLAAAQASMTANQGARVRESILELVGNMQYEEDRLLQDREKQAESSGRLTRATIATGGILALSLLVAAFFLVRQSIERGRRAEAELLLAKNSLEDRVRERTSELVKSGAALRAGEERLSRIVDSAMDAIVTVDEQQRITIFNPAAEKMFRCPVNDAVGTPLERFLPTRFRAVHREHMRAFGQNSVTRRTMGGFSPLGALRANGEEFPIEASISQVEINGRKFFTAIVRDVTETAKAREISGKLASIVESTDDAIISKTLEGVISSWNPAAERLFGYSSEEAIGKLMFLIIPPELAHEERDILARIAKGERVEHFETRRVRKDGKQIDVAVTISPLRNNSGRIIGASKIARDITERKRADEEIRQHAALLDLAPALVRDMDDRIVLWTRGAERLYGYLQKEALGSSSYDLLKTEFPQPLPDIETALKSHGVWEGELEQRTRDGQRVVVASQWVLHRDAKGQPSKILEVNTDITSLKHAESLQMRSQKLESLGTLAGGIAHDFNNILSAINGSASLAISQLPNDHPAQICLTEIEKAGARAADLVRRILTFSRPQDQNMQVQSLEPVIEEALKLVRATLPAMIEIRTEFDEDLPKARIDATQIYQVVINLATNAAHAIGDKTGVIEVKLDERIVSEQEILLYSEVPAGHYTRFLVSDNGCGMDAATLQRIFDPFFSTKPTGKGTGLGLSVVHGIVTAHRGVMKVYSEPGKGTTFHIYFPAVREPIAVVRAPEREAPMGNGERILFVDDEGVLLFVGTMTLEQNGYKVTGMPNGESALHELQQNPRGYDAVITDLSMPGLSGLQLAHQLRKLRADLPVILTSGYVNPDDQAKADRLAIRAILTKPVHTKELLSTLATLFAKKAGVDRDHLA
jgi:PAS domain S-box-containing protein